MIDAAQECEVIKKSGSWFSYGDKNIAQGKEQLRKMLKDDEALKNRIEEEVKKIIYQGG